MTSFRPDPEAFKRIAAAQNRAVKAAAEHLLEQANRTVPIEEGTLARSGRTSSDGSRAVVSYDTPYAIRQHEDTRLRHDRGRRAKWAERTFSEESTRVGRFIADEMRKAT